MKMPDLSFLLGGWNGGNKASPPAPLRRERGVISLANGGSCWGLLRSDDDVNNKA